MKSTIKHWPIIRAILLLNTVLIRPEDVGTWKNYLGYAFLFMGIIDAFFLVRNYFKV